MDVGLNRYSVRTKTRRRIKKWRRSISENKPFWLFKIERMRSFIRDAKCTLGRRTINRFEFVRTENFRRKTKNVKSIFPLRIFLRSSSATITRRPSRSNANNPTTVNRRIRTKRNVSSNFSIERSMARPRQTVSNYGIGARRNRK